MSRQRKTAAVCAVHELPEFSIEPILKLVGQAAVDAGAPSSLTMSPS